VKTGHVKLLSLGLMAALGLLTGCGALLDTLVSRMTTVELVNNGDFDVDVVLFFDDTQEVPRILLVETGTRMEFTLAPGETRRFSRPCDDLQVIVIDDADLRVAGGLGPEANSDVLRDGDDFFCGSTIRFTFDHSAAILDFDVTATTSGS